MADPKPSFPDLGAAVEFIARALETGDHDALADACVDAGEAAGPREARAYRHRAIESLAGRHTGHSLRALYAGRAFPANATTLKLGGHGRELGHVHIDFARSEATWELENIWICR